MKSFLYLLLFVFLSFSSNSQIVINELDGSNNWVEIKNLGAEMVPVGGYYLCTWPAYNSLASLDLESGSLMLEAGEIIVVSGHPFNANDGELALYLNNSFNSSSSIVDYVEWGSSGHFRAGLAMAVSQWTNGDFVPAAVAGESLMYDGSGNTSAHWFSGSPTFSAENDACDLLADFNDSGEVNSADLIQFLSIYGCLEDCGIFDLNNDEVVNTGDLVLFVTVFGSAC